MLNPRQKKFCREYIISSNGTQSVLSAGYAKKGAGVQATRLLKNANIQKYIAKLLEKAAGEAGLKIKTVLDDLNAIKQACFHGSGEKDLTTALKALEIEAKYLGMFKERIELSADKETTFKIEFVKG